MDSCGHFHCSGNKGLEADGKNGKLPNPQGKDGKHHHTAADKNHGFCGG